MRFRQVYSVVLRKELRELLRDKRSLFWLFAPPIVLPGLALCAALFIGAQAIRINREGFPVWIENAGQAPELVSYFEDSDVIYLVDPPADPETDPFGDAQVILILPDDFRQRIDHNETASVTLMTRETSVITLLAEHAVRLVLQDYEKSVIDARLNRLELTRAWLNPIDIDKKQRQTVKPVASAGDNGGSPIMVLIFLPLAVTSWLIGGGMGLILDTTVGEKERQTIENLLVTPASRTGIVMGKLTAVFLASMAVMGLWMTEGLLANALSAVSPALFGDEALSTSEALSLIVGSGGSVIGLVFVLLLVILPFTVLLNGLVMAWCAHAANYREANLFMVLLQLSLPASIMLTVFSFPAIVNKVVYVVPFLGTIIAIRDLFGGTLSSAGLVINVSSTLIYAGLSVVLAAWVFNREWSVTRGLQ